MAIRKSSNSGIPFGNTAGRPTSPSTGQPYFNGELQRLELYTGQSYGWQNIVAETPGVTGYTGTIYESTGGTITITGTNFISGAFVTLIGTDGTEYNSTTATVNNLTSMTATFSGIPGNKEPYDIRVTNPSNLYGIYYDILSVNDTPVWQTASGLLGTVNEGSYISVSVNATDEENNTITYSSSNLPAWLSLNSSTGALTGTSPGVANNTTYSFNITASDGNNTTTRAFSILVNSVVSWNTTAGSLATIYDSSRDNFTYSLSATGLANTLTYSIISGSLPNGLSLNSSTGVISGNATAVVSDTTYSFGVRVSDGTNTSDRSFNIVIKAPVVTTFTYTGSDQTYTLPAGVSIFKSYIWGAGGGNFYSSGFRGGGGGYTTGTVTASSAGATFTIVVGQAGESRGSNAGSGAKRYGGGGQLTYLGWGGQGGGLSGIFTGTSQVFNVNTPQSGAFARSVLIAGGGGGSGDVGWGGSGGGTSGRNIYTNTSGGVGSYGAGLQTDSNNGFDGSAQKGGQLYGGDANGGDQGGGGGGGAGYYGGGGGSGANGVPNSGGGGSGYIGGASGATVSNASTEQGSDYTPGGTSSAYYNNSYGFGAIDLTSAKDGRVVIVV
jgi:hypothetical protein